VVCCCSCIRLHHHFQQLYHGCCGSCIFGCCSCIGLHHHFLQLHCGCCSPCVLQLWVVVAAALGCIIISCSSLVVVAVLVYCSCGWLLQLHQVALSFPGVVSWLLWLLHLAVWLVVAFVLSFPVVASWLQSLCLLGLQRQSILSNIFTRTLYGHVTTKNCRKIHFFTNSKYHLPMTQHTNEHNDIIYLFENDNCRIYYILGTDSLFLLYKKSNNTPRVYTKYCTVHHNDSTQRAGSPAFINPLHACRGNSAYMPLYFTILGIVYIILLNFS